MSLKKGWRRYGVAVVCLVLLSMLVPLVFLLGLYGGFQTSYITDEGPSTVTDDSRLRSVLENDNSSLEAERHNPSHQGDLPNESQLLPLKVSNGGAVTKFPNFSASDIKAGIIVKDSGLKDGHNFSRTIHGNLDKLLNRHPISGGSDVLNFSWHSAKSAGLPEKSDASSFTDSSIESKQSENSAESNVKTNSNGNGFSDDSDKACEVALGSYCKWSTEHREEMGDSLVKVLKNQLFLARAYYPSISKHHNREKIQHELRQHIQSIEHMLSEATADADLPEGAQKKKKTMEVVLARNYPLDCNNVVKKLGQILDLTEDEAHFHRKQSVFLYQLAVQTMPRSHHCLSMRLTVEYFRTYEGSVESPLSKNLQDLNVYHYAIYSTNILAASVVINSTIIHAKEPEKHVFHLITDRQNYIAMKFWFLENTYRNATVHVQKLDDLNLFRSSNSMMASISSEEFRVAVESYPQKTSDPSISNRKINYLSTFNHPHFLLPEILPSLDKVLLLDEDVVVQRDLTPLWSIDLQGKVNGAVEDCEVRFHHLRKYLNSSKFFVTGFDGNQCTWMSGMNILDLQQWRKQDLTRLYKRWLKLQNRYKVPWRLGALPASLTTFYNMTYSLDKSWLSVGLGHNFGIDQHDIKKSAILHYNGALKPWLEIGIKRYKPYWAKYLKRDDHFMLDCNVNR
ncbi:probable galacturonosyltransferase 7 isoform X1 [Cryptomeria japonica]|uniref:probable galacturonosyltransferase 7 isoform X1 n=1 Tax=Cryptomeria japonica TaxID=3369 RepID=UPI0027DA9CFB|nr:probable galacturonosyltransferase 7 isoform X1 [Cryptomeria japonica]